MKKANTTVVLLLVCLISIVLKNLPLLGQTRTVTLTTTAADSISDGLWDEETYYRIGILRLQRWAAANIEALDDPVLSGEIVRLIKEANNFAGSGDFYMANIWLEMTWELIETAGESVPFGSNEQHANNPNTVKSPATDNRLKWSRSVLTGVDLWRYEFSLAAAQNVTDVDTGSAYIASSGNPFSGVRLNFDYQYSPRSILAGNVFFKYSKDYLSGEMFVKYSGTMAKESRWKLENRFEGTSFFGDFGYRYWQNRSTLAIIPRWGPVSLELRDDASIRRYTNQDTTNDNYFSNQLYLTLKLNLGLSSMFEFGYRNEIRNHSRVDFNDYREHRTQLVWTQSFGSSSHFSMEHELRFRKYPQAPEGHFLQDFWEYYFWGTFDLAVTEKFGLDVRGAFTLRDYKFTGISSLLPDYSSWEVEPQLYFKFNTNWRFGLGVHYDEETHQDLSDSRLSAADAAGVLEQGVPFEDFYSVGPVISIDFFKVSGLLFSLRESLLFRRYPNAGTSNVSDFNLYSDHYTNNILLFVTWNMTKHWQINLLANLDDERSRKEDSGDARNTLLSAEISYSF